MILVKTENNLVVMCIASSVPIDGWLEVVSAKDTIVPQPPLEVPDGDGGYFSIPQPPLIVPFAAGPGQIGTSMAMDAALIAAAMVDENGLLAPRPLSPIPTITGSTVIVPPCVAGTLISIDDGREHLVNEITETDDFEETFELEDAGEYQIEVAAPPPALPTIRRLVVK